MTQTETQESISGVTKPARNVRTILMIVSGILFACIITEAIALFLINDQTVPPIEGSNQANPVLDLYSNLPESMTVTELEASTKTYNPNAIISYDDTYEGTISIPDSFGLITFSINNENETTGDEDTQTKPDPEDIVSNIMYIIKNDYYGQSIYYSEDEDKYMISGVGDASSSSFDTKQQAIESYIANPQTHDNE